MHIRKLFTLITFVLAVSASGQYKVVTIDNVTSMPNEPSIYLNPVNPAQIVAGSNISNLYISSDTGHTWHLSNLKSSLGVYGDPVVYADEYGNFYFCHLSATKGKKFPHWIDRIVVQKSDDGGLTFSDGCYAGHNGDKEQDKHWIVKDQHSLLHKDNIYLSWTEFDQYDSRNPDDHSRIRFARSVDGAQSFEPAITISDTVGNCLDDDETLEGATPAIGPGGEVYVAWSAFGKIYFDRSDDGGRTFGRDRVIAEQKDGWALDFEHIYRSNGLPFLVADHSRGAYKNRLYLIWGEYTKESGGEIRLKYSDNGGQDWSSEITVNSVSEGDQFLPHIAVDPTDGTVYVVFYDRRHSRSNTMMDVYVAMSEDGGNTFINKRITPHSFLPPGKSVFFGDYNGISAYGGIVRPIWTSTFREDPSLKTSIQTALLTKEMLKHSDQIKAEKILFKSYESPAKSFFILYAEKKIQYRISIKVYRNGVFRLPKTYNAQGVLQPAEGVTETIVQYKKGKKAVLKMQLRGDNLNEQYEMNLF